MENFIRKYARFLVKDCLSLKENQDLLVVGNSEISSFINIIKEEAEKVSKGTVFIQENDQFKKRELMLNSSLEDCINSPLFDCHLYNEIAERHGAFLSLASPIPHIYDEIDKNLLHEISKDQEKKVKIFKEYQSNGDIIWCIAGVPNKYWASELFPEEDDSLSKLWNLILDICNIYEDDPLSVWNEYFDKINSYCHYLNNLEVKSLHYKGENGTDITFELPDNYIFKSAKDSDNIVNMPSLEIFTSPNRNGTNGIVYSTKPLIYKGVEINDFWIRFQDGKAFEWSAKTNNEMLTKMIETDDGAHYLGEIALVSNDTKISQSKVIFQTTLYDENASCHLALGRGFPECFKGNFSKEELIDLGMNTSMIHVDFMVGSDDLDITALLRDGTEVSIMKRGKFSF